MKRFALAAAAAVVFGCASTPEFEPLDVTVVNLQVVEMTLFETALDVQLRLNNPNPVPLELEGASFKLYLDGKKVGSGATDEALELPRLDSVVVRADVHINNASALLRLRGIFEQREVSYGVQGRVFVAGEHGTTALKFAQEGQLDLDPESLPPIPGSIPDTKNPMDHDFDGEGSAPRS